MSSRSAKHRALSWKYACKLEKQLNSEVKDLLRQTDAADQTDLPDGLDVPEELARREERLAAIAKSEIERRATERYGEEQADYEKKLADRKAKEQEPGTKTKSASPTNNPGSCQSPEAGSINVTTLRPASLSRRCRLSVDTPAKTQKQTENSACP